LDRVPGEQVYCILTKNALSSRMHINKLAPHLPKDNKEVNAHLKRLQAMLDTAIMVDPTLDRDDEARGQELDHQWSSHGDSASNLTPLEECGRRRHQNDRDLCDIIHDKDAHGRIGNQCQERERLEQEQCEERDYDFYGPYYDQPHCQHCCD
jgi:hypothetical protein